MSSSSVDNFPSDTTNEFSKLHITETSSPVKKGDILLTSIPFAYVLKSTLRGLHCDTCLRKKQGAQRCSSCASAYYCNRECQKNSWEIHKKECSKLKKLKPKLPPDTARLMARILFRLNDGGDEFEENVTAKRCRKFKDLMNHYNDVKEDSFRQEHFTSLLVVLKKYLGEENLPNTTELLAIYGRVLVNSFTITDKDMNPVGIGVYLAASILDHSCQPNAYASFVGTQIFVRSLYDDPEMDLKKVRISYIDVLNTTKDRNKDLEKGYFFTCHCAHCGDKERENITSSIACGNAECSQPIHVDTDSDPEEAIEGCPQCGFQEFEPGTRERYYEVLELTRTKLDEMRNKNCGGRKHGVHLYGRDIFMNPGPVIGHADSHYGKAGAIAQRLTSQHEALDTCKTLLEKQGSLFHRLNLWRVKLLDAAFDAAIDSRSLDTCVAYGCQNVEGMRFYYGSNHPMYGMHLLKLAKIELYLFRLQEALNHLEEAEPILKVSHGETHPLYADDLMPLLEQARQEIKMMQCNGFKVMKKPPGSQKTILP